MATLHEFSHADLDRLGLSLQVRIRLDLQRVEHLADLLASGVEIDPVIAYQTPLRLCLTDGFHRVAGFRRWAVQGLGNPAAPMTLRAEVRQGSEQDARIHAATANAAHRGLPLDRASRDRAILWLRAEGWSFGDIAQRFGLPRATVSDAFYRATRQDAQPAQDPTEHRLRGDDLYRLLVLSEALGQADPNELVRAMLEADRAGWGTLEPRPASDEYAEMLRDGARRLRRAGARLRRLQSPEVLDAMAERLEQYAKEISRPRTG